MMNMQWQSKLASVVLAAMVCVTGSNVCFAGRLGGGGRLLGGGSRGASNSTTVLPIVYVQSPTVYAVDEVHYTPTVSVPAPSTIWTTYTAPQTSYVTKTQYAPVHAPIHRWQTIQSVQAPLVATVSAPTYTSHRIDTTPNYYPVSNVVNEVTTVTTAPMQKPVSQVVTASHFATTTSPSLPDLILEDIRLESPATLVAGPAYRVKLRNQGTTDCGKFQAALFASVGGEPTESSPKVTVELAQLGAGQVTEVVLRLPASSMQMQTSDGSRSEFKVMYVAIDWQNNVSEIDESNNAVALERMMVDKAGQ